MIGLSGNQICLNTCEAAVCATSESSVGDVVDQSDCCDAVDVCVDEPDSELFHFGPGERDHYRDVQTSLIQSVGDFRELVGLGQLDLL